MGRGSGGVESLRAGGPARRTADAPAARAGRSRLRDALRLVRQRPTLAASVGILGLTLGVAAWPGAVAPLDPVAIDASKILTPPGPDHWLGTDEVGRDLFSRVIHGARPSVLSALVAVGLAATLGSLLGLTAGTGPRWLETLIMRVSDMLLAFPLFILAMGIVAALGRGLVNAVIAGVVVWWPQYARLIRASALSVRESAYVEGAHALGASWWAVLWRHVMPNCLSPIFTKASLDLGYMLLVLSGLSFIGLGAQPPTPEWGSMVTLGRSFILSHWWYPAFPGLAILLVSIACNVLGDALRDLFDPHGLVQATEQHKR